MDRTGAVLVDTYRIERLIAEGGMGAVYEASHLRIPKKFAVKFLKVSLLDNSIALLRFRREAEVVATLDHPHIVSLFDYNITEDGVPYTILEYLEGEHLGDRVGRGRLVLAEVLRIGEAVGGALAAAHDKGIVHRDLKPENVILCTQGAIKVVDFGIAKLRGGQELTAFNSILGTITYMAPEQLMAGQIDARADQFALGAIVYEMLSGDMPFGSDGTIPEIAERVLRKQPAPIDGYPSTVMDVILRAMSKDAAQRYPDVAAFVTALKEVTQPLVDAARGNASGPVPVPKSSLPATVERPTVVPPVSIAAPVGGATAPIAPAPIVAAPVATPVAGPDVVTAAASVVSEPAPADEGLPELPEERTAISNAPTVMATIPATPTLEEEPADQPAETTRITRSDPAISVAPPESRTRSGRRPEIVTGRMNVLRGSVLDRLGRRGWIIVGVMLGVVVAVVVGLLLR